MWKSSGNKRRQKRRTSFGPPLLPAVSDFCEFHVDRHIVRGHEKGIGAPTAGKGDRPHPVVISDFEEGQLVARVGRDAQGYFFPLGIVDGADGDFAVELAVVGGVGDVRSAGAIRVPWDPGDVRSSIILNNIIRPARISRRIVNAIVASLKAIFPQCGYLAEKRSKVGSSGK